MSIDTKLNINSIEDKSIPKSKLNDSIFEGSYDNMTVGSANHADSASDLTGHNESSEQSFIFQPSAGDMSIKDDSAYIKKIKGNSVVWNQLVDRNVIPNGTVAGVTITHNEADDSITLNGTVSAGNVLYLNVAFSTVKVGEKILLVGSKNLPPFQFYINGGMDGSAPIISDGIITCASTGSHNSIFFYFVSGTEFVNITISPKVYNLTQMFGEFNEPSTIEEFYARIPSGIDINAYNEGEIINLNTEAIKTIGFNQWDEQWETGYYDVSTGNKYDSSTYFRSKNKIKIVGGEDYYSNLIGARFLFYDSNDKYLGYQSIPGGAAGIVSTPLNAQYMTFFSETTYFNDNLCFNLSHTGWKNGTYEPYKEFTRELPAIEKYFPTGMKKAGDVYDSIEWDSSKQKWVAVQRVGSVDLGELSGAYVSEYGHYQINISDKKPAMSIGDGSNLTCSKYSATPVTYASNASKPLYSVMESTSEARTLIYVVDPTCTDASSYLSTLNGVILYYELAEPIITEIDEEYVNFDYYVEDFGTEEAISSVASASFSADIVYQFNAVDRIRDNDRKIDAISENYVKRKSDKEISIMAHGYYDEIVSEGISSGLSMIPASESKLYATDNYHSNFVSELRTRINKTNNIPEIRLYTGGYIPDNNTMDGYIDAYSTLIFDPISLKIDGRTIAPIGDLKSNTSYGNVIYMDKPHIIYSDTGTNNICLLRFNELCVTNKTIYGYPYTLIFNHTNGNDGLFGIDTAIEFNFDEYVFNYESCEIKWTDNQIYMLSEDELSNLGPDFADFEHIYIIPSRDDNGNPYSYSEIQIVKYGENLPWFGVVAHYY